MAEKKDSFDMQLEFAKHIGFKSPALAMANLGKYEFQKQFKLHKESIVNKQKEEPEPNPKPQPEKEILIVEKPKKIRRFIKKPTPEEIRKRTEIEFEMMLQGAKKMYFDENYLIFPDGKIYSLVSFKYLTPTSKKNTFGHKFHQYALRNGTKFIVARLVYLHFGNHQKRSYEEIDKLIHKDSNTENYHIDNLEEITQSELNERKVGAFIGRDSKVIIEAASKIKEEHRENISKLLTMGYSKEAIGRLYNVSKTSVDRFLKRHELIKN